MRSQIIVKSNIFDKIKNYMSTDMSNTRSREQLLQRTNSMLHNVMEHKKK